MRRTLLFVAIFGFWQPIGAVTVSIQQLAAASTIASNVVPHVLHPKKFAKTLKSEVARMKKKKTGK